MGPAFAAVGAGVAALLEGTIASRFLFAGAQLQIVLVFAIVLTIVFSFEDGLAWAFVGGIFADLLAVRPLGSTLFGLLIAVGGTAALIHYLSLGRLLNSVVCVFFMTLAYVVVVDGVVGVLDPPAYPLHLTSLFGTALVNAAFSALVAGLVIATKRRFVERRQRLVW